MKRRHFLKYSAAGVVIPSFINGFQLKAMASSPMLQALQQTMTQTDRVLVMIQLGGGNDGLNTVIPIDQYDNLTIVRPQVVLPENELLSLSGNDAVGLHPAMTGLQQLYNNEKLKIIQAVGYPNQNYSHFRSTDIWMSGSDEDEYLLSGWAGRYLNGEYPNFPYDYPNESMTDPLAIEIGYSQSFVFQGPLTTMAVTLSNADSFYNLVNGINDPVPNTPAGEQLEYVRLISKQSNAYGEVMINAFNSTVNMVTYPDNNELAQQLKIVARMIAGGLKTRIYLVHIDGFDTHDSQVDYNDHTVGEHANLLRNLSEAISVFQSDIEALSLDDKVIGMTFSEFGRRTISNLSGGTDHGAAAPMFMFGTSIAGGVLGENPIIPADATEDTNVAMQHDFRSVYATILKEWFCIAENELSQTLFQSYDDLPLFNNIDCISTGIHHSNQHAGTALLTVLPNPVLNEATIEITSLGGLLHLALYDVSGRYLQSIFNANIAIGNHRITHDFSNLNAGLYYLHYQQGATKQVIKIIKA